MKCCDTHEADGNQSQAIRAMCEGRTSREHRSSRAASKGRRGAGFGEAEARARGGGGGLGGGGTPGSGKRRLVFGEEEAAARARGGGGVEVGDDGLGGGGMLETLNRLSGGRGKP